MQPSQDLYEELLRLLARQSRRVPIPVAFATIIIATFASDAIPFAVWSGWLGMVFTVLVVRLITIQRLCDLTEIPIQRRLLTAVLLSATNGIVHGSSLAFFPFLSDVERVIQSVLILGLCTGALVTTAGYKPLYLSYLTATATPMAAMWLWLASTRLDSDPLIPLSMAVLVLMNAWILIALAADSFRLFRESFEIRLQQTAMNAELQNALDAAEASNRAKTQFLASASHDLRQPIWSLSLDVHSLSNSTLDKGNREIVGRMESVLSSLAPQLDALLDISKLDAGIIEPQHKQFDLCYVLHTLQDEFVPAARQKKISIVVDVEEPLLIVTDPVLLNRIIQNLLANAVKYTDQGEVHISARIENECVLRVRDTGRGIPQSEQERIFEEFYQLENPGRDRNKGLGLGLAIVRRLTSLLAIELQLESALGTGTVFTLRIPTADEATDRSPEKLTDQVELAGLRILIVDDELHVRASLRTALEKEGCSVWVAGSTRQALEISQREPPDILIADFRLQGVDNGIATIEAIRAEIPALRAILVTGDIAPDRLQQAGAANLPLLHKPVSTEKLRRTIAKVCARNNDEQQRDPAEIK